MSDERFDRMMLAFQQTKLQLELLKAVEGSIDEKIKAPIRQLIVGEIDGIVKELKESVYPGIDLDNLTPNAREDQMTWIEGYPIEGYLTGILPIYRLRVHTVLPSLLLYDMRTSSAYLPTDVFMKMISDLKTSISKGEMDKQIPSRTEIIIYTRMRQVQETLIPEWKKQEDPQYKREKAQMRVIDNMRRSLTRAKGTNESQCAR